MKIGDIVPTVALTLLLGIPPSFADSSNPPVTKIPEKTDFSKSINTPVGQAQVTNVTNNDGTTTSDSSGDGLTVSIADLVTDVANLQCMDYEVKGICVWLSCVGIKCSIKTSVVVSHYNPDAIVETISNNTKTPVDWLTRQFKPVFQPVSKAMNGGFTVGTGIQSAYKTSTKQENFYDVNVYGNPALLVYRDVIGSMLETVGFCKSGVQPFQPYMASVVDSEWRWGLLESVLTAVPTYFPRKLAARNGADIQSVVSGELFGYIYPRVGSVRNPKRYLGSMVVAQRAADIVTSKFSSHTVLPLPDVVFGYKTWAPNQAKEGDGRTAKWQRNYPRGRTSCMVFPNDTTDSFNYSSSSDYSPTHNYLYTLWRRYECCRIRGKFIKRLG
jgi:integrating conjugative element protein (TIGR03756 family)